MKVRTVYITVCSLQNPSEFRELNPLAPRLTTEFRALVSVCLNVPKPFSV
jgi:hypothetical protein